MRMVPGTTQCPTPQTQPNCSEIAGHWTLGPVAKFNTNRQHSRLSVFCACFWSWGKHVWIQVRICSHTIEADASLVRSARGRKPHLADSVWSSELALSPKHAWLNMLRGATLRAGVLDVTLCSFVFICFCSTVLNEEFLFSFWTSSQHDPVLCSCQQKYRTRAGRGSLRTSCQDHVLL